MLLKNGKCVDFTLSCVTLDLRQQCDIGHLDISEPVIFHM